MSLDVFAIAAVHVEDGDFYESAGVSAPALSLKINRALLELEVCAVNASVIQLQDQLATSTRP